MKYTNKFMSAVVGALAMIAAQPSFSDDSEVFTNTAFLASGVRPNVLFIIDTSGSMDTQVNSYDPSITYEGPCAAGRVFWRTSNTSAPPSCTTDRWISVNNNRCRAAAVGMAANGWWRGRTAMIVPGSGSTTKWGELQEDRDAKIECWSDRNKHGDLPGTTAPGGENKYPRNGTGSSDANRWGNSGSSNQANFNDSDYDVSLYSSNYANWYHGNPGDSTPRTRLDIVQRAANILVDNLDGVNLGIMRYSTDAQGGMVRYPVSELTDDNKAAIKAEINAYNASGNTPLSETLYEAYLYLSGGKVDYGNRSSPNLSIESSRVDGGDTYDSPMDFSCQNTYIVYLTDGLPTTDTDADDEIEALPDFEEDGGGACPDTGSGACLENLARYMHNHDLRDDFGVQTVTTYFIGFGSDIASSASYLENVAAAGGGKAYTADDAGGLASTLEEIFAEVQEASDTTFVSPAVSVNAFNRTQNLNDLFVSVFQPTKNLHWPGNIKKYRIIDGEIYGADDKTPAVDPETGFFHKDSKALNTPGTEADGPDATKGGSAARLPSYTAGQRKLYTYLGAEAALTNAKNAVEVGNAELTAEKMGAEDATERETYIEFARGRDLRDIDADESTTENRFRMGDPMHAQPAIVIYSGSAEDPVGTVFSPTNDGYLHAFDMETGDELWAYVPEEFLSRAEDLYVNSPTVTRTYGLDGDVRVFKYDVNQNGIVESGDKVYLFFGTRRGGSTYYALDVTDREKPKFLWKKDQTTLTKLGQAWSTPEIARVNIAGATQNSQYFVLIFGGGYDTDQENYKYTEDDEGNAIYMVDLETGAVLWTASNADADFVHDDMDHSIPAGISVMDTDGDFFADRMYAADLGGRVWRFDIWNGKAAGSLVTGGVLASLGGAADPDEPSANRRFYGSPDVSPISIRGSRPFFNIAIGSGYRGHPLHVNDEPGVEPAQDRFYSIRDYSPFTRLTKEAWDKRTPVNDDELFDVTDTALPVITDGSPGWRLELRYPEWRGEKVLSDSTTAAGVIFFTTFTPLSPDPDKPCLANTLNRVYAMYASNARPFTQWDGEVPDDEWKPEHRYDELAQRGIAPGVQILPGRDGNGGGKGICQVGAQILNHCVKFGDAVRSYWEHR